jgi:hypothetical protein
MEFISIKPLSLYWYSFYAFSLFSWQVKVYVKMRQQKLSSNLS